MKTTAERRALREAYAKPEQGVRYTMPVEAAKGRVERARRRKRAWYAGHPDALLRYAARSARRSLEYIEQSMTAVTKTLLELSEALQSAFSGASDQLEALEDDCRIRPCECGCPEPEIVGDPFEGVGWYAIRCPECGRTTGFSCDIDALYDAWDEGRVWLPHDFMEEEE